MTMMMTCPLCGGEIKLESKHLLSSTIEIERCQNDDCREWFYLPGQMDLILDDIQKRKEND